MEGLGEAFLALAQQLLGDLSLRDVPADPDDLADFAGRPEDGRVVPGQPPPALHGHGALFHVGGVGRFEEGFHGLRRGRQIILVDHGHERLAEQFRL